MAYNDYSVTTSDAQEITGKKDYPMIRFSYTFGFRLGEKSFFQKNEGCLLRFEDNDVLAWRNSSHRAGARFVSMASVTPDLYDAVMLSLEKQGLVERLKVIFTRYKESRVLDGEGRWKTNPIEGVPETNTVSLGSGI